MLEFQCLPQDTLGLPFQISDHKLPMLFDVHQLDVLDSDIEIDVLQLEFF